MTVTAEQAKAMLDAATPGPWKWFPEEREVCNYGTREWTSGVEEWWCIASFYVNDEEPDARLIAAAPDLAATVVELEAERDLLAEDLTLANSVIATVEAERDKLARWKAEAKVVIAGWIHVWNVAGRPGALGESTSDATGKHITALQAAIDKQDERCSLLQGESDDLRSRIAEVLAWHSESEFGCTACSWSWPCDIVQALTQGGEAPQMMQPIWPKKAGNDTVAMEDIETQGGEES